MMADERKGLYIPRAVLYDSQLGYSMKFVYSVMIEGMDEDCICRLSSEEIGNRIGITKGAANQNRKKLCRLGYVRLIPNTQRNYRIMKIRKRKEANNE